MKKPALKILLLVAFVLGLHTSAGAHAFLDRAFPKVGGEISPAPTEVKIWFTQAIEPAFSRVQVFSADGTQVDRKDTHVDKDDSHLLIVSLEPIQTGVYKVEWKVVSVDTHRTQGDFKFTVKP